MRKRREINIGVFGYNLRFYRQLRGYRVEEVKEYLCLGSVQVIYKWESGKCFPQADTLMALAELYQVELRDLTEEKWWNKSTSLDLVYYPLPESEERDAIIITMRRCCHSIAEL